MSNRSRVIENKWMQAIHDDATSGIRMESRPWTHSDSDLLEKPQQKLQPPSLYNVILNNDDYTPMEFVIDVLQKFFSYDIERATQLMLTVHYEGKAVCGVYSADVAETKTVQVNRYARENEHPLLCTLERA
ncbi:MULTISPECIES: ATP-dependent Clp protease adapter ClpS [unclassified Symbiopectobacterium]|uniref:ATP-dependent Clp protease adapter ClpS n=1 Tax=unclassified Symbiopectobacterium TaxID=2794573 RepID=UPI002227F4C1|nr:MULTISPECIES: ATP-dependent Clp protease adapter ClpS [unclassified Symbiopectobacterium]